MEIIVMADLFGIGIPIDGADLRLGMDPQPKGSPIEPPCRAVASGDAEYTILAGLADCGTQLKLTDDTLTYTNKLVYSPKPSPDGIIRFETTEFVIECHYQRQYSVNSVALLPTWVPFTTTQSAEDFLDFSLRLMADDWSSVRSSSIYYLGDVMHLEASVNQYHHMPLRLFVDSCLATLEPDVNSSPRYAFIENNGCLTDGKLTGSRSHFMSRIQDNKLQFMLDAFRFHRDARSSLYITCLLKAVPSGFSAQSGNRACCWYDGRWMSADGNDQVCGGCDASAGSSPPSSPSAPVRYGKVMANAGVWKRGTDPKADIPLTEEFETADELAFPMAEESGTFVDTLDALDQVNSSAVTVAILDELNETSENTTAVPPTDVDTLDSLVDVASALKCGDTVCRGEDQQCCAQGNGSATERCCNHPLHTFFGNMGWITRKLSGILILLLLFAMGYFIQRIVCPRPRRRQQEPSLLSGHATASQDSLLERVPERTLGDVTPTVPLPAYDEVKYLPTYEETMHEVPRVRAAPAAVS
ncbi:zona pellucida sperm-binding protein 3-like [Megalops cyprinoides]|uniref:zona pellucida sperm-binding protein 3-like n=1 Tax=Megalops cyprinoides TaxID=118141 RepID=UPI001864B780|nr:zona pellucida sperm-binding protein 3-like [Megalops cyprinoides]